MAREPSSVGLARRALTAQLSSWGLHEVTDTSRLLVSELITNSLRHAHGPVRVNLRVRGALLRCEVEDASPTWWSGASRCARSARTHEDTWIRPGASRAGCT
ncbi:ATP-binding protein [Streptomyces virginiae]|uniref:ATP-binding protein n=1 Tax=Streptomyces virginiae TaxID=1961 RepID=UPI0033AC2E8F